MLLSILLATLSVLSLAIGIWQLVVAMRFPLCPRGGLSIGPAPGISVLKPLKGCDTQTEACLTSWMQQRYAGPVEILFGVASSADPEAELARRLAQDKPALAVRVVICGEHSGPNPKVAKLAQLAKQARHEILCISDADVHAEPDFLAIAMNALRVPGTGLVNALYRFAPGRTFASRLEALAVNADFWSQVLQARSLGPLRFALGAAMLLPRATLAEIGGFEAIQNHLADDYELGRRVAKTGAAVQVAGVVVECRSASVSPRGVWNHQLRWARTIRSCRPWSYFFSIVSNATLWPVLWFSSSPGIASAIGLIACICFRGWAASRMEARLTGRSSFATMGLVVVKDLLQALLWVAAFLGQTVIWRNVTYRLAAGGKVAPRHEFVQSAAEAPPSAAAQKDAGAA